MVPEGMKKGSDVQETQLGVKLHSGWKKNGRALVDGSVTMVALRHH